MPFMKYIFAVLCVLMAWGNPAKAEVFVWNDPATSLSLSYPDHWLRQAQLDGGEKLLISHPQGHDLAQCVLSAQDKTDRLLNAQTVLDGLLNMGYGDATVTSHRDHASWANRVATITGARFSMMVDGQAYPMQAVQYSTLFKGQLHTLLCSAYQPRYQIHAGLFASVAASVKSKIIATPYPNGRYRDFTREHVYLFVDKHRRGVVKF